MMDISMAYMLVRAAYCKYVEKNVDKAWTGYLSADEKEIERHLDKLICLLSDMNPRLLFSSKSSRTLFWKSLRQVINYRPSRGHSKKSGRWWMGRQENTYRVC